jgi:hypothetical protein
MAFRSIMALAIPGLKLDVCGIFCFIFLLSIVRKILELHDRYI